MSYQVVSVSMFPVAPAVKAVVVAATPVGIVRPLTLPVVSPLAKKYSYLVVPSVDQPIASKVVPKALVSPKIEI